MGADVLIEIALIIPRDFPNLIERIATLWTTRNGPFRTVLYVDRMSSLNPPKDLREHLHNHGSNENFMFGKSCMLNSFCQKHINL